MSKKKEDIGKLYHKLHQLQKRMTRMEENAGHSDEKQQIRQTRINELLTAIKGSGRKKIPRNFRQAIGKRTHANCSCCGSRTKFCSCKLSRYHWYSKRAHENASF
jgi:hypothetical protein